MKETTLIAGQKWRTYAFDPTLCGPESRMKVASYGLSTRDVALLPSSPGEDSYVYSDDPRVYRFKKIVSEKLTGHLPSSVDATGCHGSNAVSSNFMSLRTANRPMYPAIPPIANNLPTRADRGLASNWLNPAHRRIFNQLAEAMTSSYTPGSIRISDHSTSGYPWFISDALEKKRLFLERLPFVDDIIDLAISGRLEDLYRKHQVVIAYRMSSRRQADSQIKDEDGTWSVKDRKVPDLAYALTDGEKGRILVASRYNPDDKEVPLCRLRSVYGLSSTANLILACTFDGFNQWIFDQYQKTFKSRGALDIAESVNKWPFHSAVDVKDHDFLVPEFIINELFEVLSTRLDERLVKFTQMCWRAPAYVPNPNIYQKANPFWLGHPLNADDFNHWYGLPSGIFHVAFAGKYGCMGVYLCKLHDIGVPVIDRIDEILRWTHPDVAILDTGDDAVVCFTSKNTKALFDISLEKQEYYATGPEPLGYLGHSFWRSAPDEGPISVSLKPESYIINPWVKERGLDSVRFSPFWARGVDAREQTFASIPNYGFLRDMWRGHFRDIFGYDYDQAVRSHPNYRKQLPNVVLTAADLAVLDDPSKIHYRFQDTDLSPQVADLFTKKLKVEDYFDFVKHLIKCPLTTG